MGRQWKSRVKKVISIALMEWNDSYLKGSDLYKDGEDYIITYENGKEAQFLPGSLEFFNLKRYKEEVGKDFKRIVLFLCTIADQQTSERCTQEEEDILSVSDTNETEEYQVPLTKKARFDPAIAQDEILAREMQAAFDGEMR